VHCLCVYVCGYVCVCVCACGYVCVCVCACGCVVGVCVFEIRGTHNPHHMNSHLPHTHFLTHPPSLTRKFTLSPTHSLSLASSAICLVPPATGSSGTAYRHGAIECLTRRATRRAVCVCVCVRVCVHMCVSPLSLSLFLSLSLWLSLCVCPLSVSLSSPPCSVLELSNQKEDYVAQIEQLKRAEGCVCVCVCERCV